MIAFLKGNPIVQMAARVGKTFQIDPILVIDDGGDPLLPKIRIAAAQVCADDERKAAEASKPRGGRRR